MTKVNEVIEKNLKWVFMLAFGVLVLWLNSKYVTIDKYENLKEEHTELKENFNLYKSNAELIRSGFLKDLKSIDERLDKKIKIINGHQQEMIDNRIDIEILKYKTR